MRMNLTKIKSGHSFSSKKLWTDSLLGKNLDFDIFIFLLLYFLPSSAQLQPQWNGAGFILSFISPSHLSACQATRPPERESTF